jgi:hypothetical protein
LGVCFSTHGRKPENEPRPFLWRKYMNS